MAAIVTKILIIFAMTFVGFIAAKIKLIPYSASEYLVSLLLSVTMPAMILSAMSTQTLDDEIKDDVVTMLIISIAWFIIIPLLVFFFSKTLRKTPKKDIGVMMAIMTTVNTGFMGFPVTKAIFGPKMFFLIVIQNMILTIYLYTLAVFQINHAHLSNKGFLSTLKSSFSLCTISSLLGLIILFTQFKMPAPALEFLDMLGSATVPLSMIIVGIQLSESHIFDLIKNVDLIIASIANTILIPIVTFLLVNWLPVSPEIKATTIFASAFPCAVSLVGISAREKQNSVLAAHGVTLTTAMSLITLPLIASFIGAFYNVI